MVIGSGGRADQKTTDGEAARGDRLSVQSGRVMPAVLSEMIIAPENSLCVCVRNASEETSLPPLNAPESVSMVMNKRNREDKRTHSEQPGGSR